MAIFYERRYTFAIILWQKFEKDCILTDYRYTLYHANIYWRTMNLIEMELLMQFVYGEILSRKPNARIQADITSTPACRCFIHSSLVNTKNPSGTSAKNKKLRYVGSLVADAHRTLINGGIFVYPPDKNNPSGKLRLMYEANPFALIFTSAGGNAVDLEKEILDIEPENFHQRTPLILGSKSDVNNFLDHMAIGNKKIKENTEITPIFKWSSNSIRDYYY